MELKRKLAAIMVADVVGYSRLMSNDEEATLRRLEVFRGIWQDCAVRYGGRIFNTAGDAILAEFPSAVEAVRCAVDFQTQAKTQNEALVPTRQMQFRIGITIGDVVEREGDLLGDGVNIAARLQGLASPGGICVSSWVREAISNKLDIGFKDLGEQTVKNIPTPIRAYAIGHVEAIAAPLAVSSVLPAWLGRLAGGWQGWAATAAVAVLGIALALTFASRHRSSGPVVVVAPPGAQTGTPKSDPASGSGGKSASISGRPGDAPTSAPASGGGVSPGGAPASAGLRSGVLSDETERNIKPGERFKECPTCSEMVVIPRGEFVMGSAPGQPGHESDEAPTRKVVIGKAFAVGRFAVTYDEYDTFITVSGYKPAPGCRVFEGGRWVDKSELSFRNPGFPQRGDHPVACINWNDAKAYVDWLAARMGREYRLLSEAEREYATRAGSSSAFWWGNDVTPTQAAYDWSMVFAKNSSGAQSGQPGRGTQPVAAFSANPWGLYQVHGNVSEWTEDCWNSSYRSAPVDGTAWVAGDCGRRVLRGGSWGYAPKDLRSAYREGATLSYRNFNFGFRVARSLRGLP